MNFLLATIRLLTGDVRALDVAINDTAGNQLSGFDSTRPATATLTNVVTGTISAVLLAANVARRQVFIYNDSNSTLYVKFGTTASVTSFTVLIPKNGAWESVLNGYTGTIDGVLSSGAGTARVTEVTT